LPAIRALANSDLRKTLEYYDEGYEGSVWKRRRVKDSDYVKQKKELLEGHAAFKKKTEIH